MRMHSYSGQVIDITSTKKRAVHHLKLGLACSVPIMKQQLQPLVTTTDS